jgi:hypothetical protein
VAEINENGVDECKMKSKKPGGGIEVWRVVSFSEGEESARHRSMQTKP